MRTKEALVDYSIAIASVVALALVASGCAGAAAARRMSATTAQLTDSYKAETQKFFEAQDVMVQALLQTTASRTQMAATLDNQTRVQRASWQASNNTDAVRIYDSLSAQSDTAILSSDIGLQSLHPAASPASTTIDPKPFESVTQNLNQMAQKPSLSDQASFLFTEAKDVSTQYKESLKNGAKSANQAANNTKQPKPPAR
jgi:hypothetical protein